LYFLVCLAGCAGVPEQAYRLPESSLSLREMQTRTFEVEDESEIFAASVALLQDMEYNLDAIERPLGVLTASKTVDADSAAEKAGLIALDVGMVILAALGGGEPGASAYASANDEVRLDMTLVVLPSLSRDGAYTARVTLQRTLFDKSDRVKETGNIEDPAVYEEIFAKLSSSIFLEGADQ
jgi:hypothetical protein